MAERARQRAGRELAAARRLLEAGDVREALRPLERARRDFLAAADETGLREVRAAAEDGYRRSDSADEPAYERLLYASAQNIRFLSRRSATATGREWIDPHPELDRSDRPEIRAERGITRRDIPWITLAAAAGLLGVAAVAAFYIWGIFFSITLHRATIRNDSGRAVVVGVCAGPCDQLSDVRLLRPGRRSTVRETDPIWFTVQTPSGRRIGCVEARKPERGALVSAAGRCPAFEMP